MSQNLVYRSKLVKISLVSGRNESQFRFSGRNLDYLVKISQHSVNLRSTFVNILVFTSKYCFFEVKMSQKFGFRSKSFSVKVKNNRHMNNTSSKLLNSIDNHDANANQR